MKIQKEIYSKILAIVMGFLILHFILGNKYLLYVATAIGLTTLTVPQIGSLIIRVWDKLAFFLGRINTFIILTLIFFFLLWPLSLIYKLRVGDKLRLKDTESSMFVSVEKQYTRSDLENPW